MFRKNDLADHSLPELCFKRNYNREKQKYSSYIERYKKIHGK